MENKENKKQKEKAEFEESLKKLADIVAKDPMNMSKTIVPSYLVEFVNFMAKLTPEEREDLVSDPFLIFKNERFRNVNSRIKSMISLYGMLLRIMAEVNLDVNYISKKLNKKLNIKIDENQKRGIIELSTIELVHALFDLLTSMPSEEVIKKYATIENHS